MTKQDLNIVGTSVRRADVPKKITGEAKYTGDYVWPGLLHGKTKRAEIAHARIRNIDVSKALALPGVKAVLTHKDVPRVLHYGSPHPRSAACTKDQYILDDTVRFWGEGIAAVAAISEEIADEALDLIEVEYEPLPGVYDTDSAQLPDAPQIHDHGPGGNLVFPPIQALRGDVDAGFAEADLILEGEFAGGRPVPTYMEPNICVADWDSAGKLTFWSSTQTSFMVRGALAEVLGLPLNKVRVLVENMGGGFGAKQDLFQHEFLCALLSRTCRRPVKMEFTRRETFLAGRTRHPIKVWLKQGFRKDGTLVARDMKLVYDSGGYGSHSPGVTTVGTFSSTSLYRVENVRVDGRAVYTNAPISGAFRGYGVVQTYFPIDIQIDEAAEKLGIDPVEMRLRNAVRTGDIAPSGHPIIGHGLEACLEHGRKAFDWAAKRDNPDRSDPANPAIRKGWGVGCEMHGSSAYPGLKEQGNATIKMQEDGSVTLLTGAADLGTGAHTVMAQIVAEELGVPFATVEVVHGDTDVVPWDIGAFASHTTYLVGSATKIAAGKLKARVLARAAEKLQESAEHLRMADGIITVEGKPGVSLTLFDAVCPAKGLPAEHLIENGTYNPTKSYSFGAHFVEVAVDTETGIIECRKVMPVHEIGRVVHPIACEGQIEGGVLQGVGHTLTEDFRIDPLNGRPLNAGLVDYKLPLSMDAPEIQTVILETAPDPGGPWGAKGVAEDPIIAIGPAIANAVYDAIGVRFHHYPITPEDVLNGLRRKAAGEASA